ncbi:MAG: hypothetical protein CM1200mP34_2140 [Verrucomicrobiales bacterium]|nr:MAG: hypothetical protein CM1200mP34_2140 [Verrucomicrobiales bacterium]
MPPPGRWCSRRTGGPLAFADITAETDFFVKGQSFDLARFLGDDGLAKRYDGGSMLLSRLCPLDYHRFHFPCAGGAGVPRFINGWLYSVNPIALVTRPSIFWENKRVVRRSSRLSLAKCSSSRSVRPWSAVSGRPTCPARRWPRARRKATLPSAVPAWRFCLERPNRVRRRPAG